MQEVVGVAENPLARALAEFQIVTQILSVGQDELLELFGALLAVAEADLAKSVEGLIRIV